MQLFPGLEAEWYEFHDAVMKRQAIEWLADNDLVDEAEAAAAIRAMQEPV